MNKKLNKDLYYHNINDNSGDIGITIFEKDDSILADLIDYDRTKAKLILQKYNLIKDNGDIILPKGLELIDEEQHGGATEYTFSLKYVNIKLDLAEVDHYFE